MEWPINIDLRELSQILAALRYWQDNVGEEERKELSGYGHFEDHEPMNGDEIDELCEKINFKSKDDLIAFDAKWTLVELEEYLQENCNGAKGVDFPLESLKRVARVCSEWFEGGSTYENQCEWLQILFKTEDFRDVIREEVAKKRIMDKKKSL